jgi:outer membrane protein OmpA-like peptidoglycan-associated protein
MRILFIVSTFIFSHTLLAQFTLSGQWVGILTNPTQGFEAGYPVLLELDAVQQSAVGIFRLEKGENWFQYEVSGRYENKKEFTLASGKEVVMKKHQLSSSPFRFVFAYNDSSDLATGIFSCSGSPFDGFAFHLEKVSTPYVLGSNLLFNQAFILQCLQDRALGLPSKTKRNQEIALFQFQPIYFAYDSYTLEPTFYSFLQKVVRVVNSHSDLRIEIIGNTDGDGSDEYNMKLSMNRALTVQRYLEKNGISATRISITFEGEKNPVDRNDTEAGKQKNRRVEIRFN